MRNYVPRTLYQVPSKLCITDSRNQLPGPLRPCILCTPNSKPCPLHTRNHAFPIETWQRNFTPLMSKIKVKPLTFHHRKYVSSFYFHYPGEILSTYFFFTQCGNILFVLLALLILPLHQPHDLKAFWLFQDWKSFTEQLNDVVDSHLEENGIASLEDLSDSERILFLDNAIRNLHSGTSNCNYRLDSLSIKTLVLLYTMTIIQSQQVFSVHVFVCASWLSILRLDYR